MKDYACIWTIEGNGHFVTWTDSLDEAIEIRRSRLAEGCYGAWVVHCPPFLPSKVEPLRDHT